MRNKLKNINSILMLKLKKSFKSVKVAVESNRILSGTICKVNKRVCRKELKGKGQWVPKERDKNSQQLHLQCQFLNSSFQIQMYMSLFFRLNWLIAKTISILTEWKTNFIRSHSEMTFEWNTDDRNKFLKLQKNHFKNQSCKKVKRLILI